MSEVLQTEKQIIHLMLHNRQAVAAVAESTVRSEHFSQHAQILVDALFQAELRNASLTRLSFHAFLEDRHYSTRDQIAAKAMFNECLSTIIGVKQDDLDALLKKKWRSFVEQKSLDLLE